jgi:hypothetical protein
MSRHLILGIILLVSVPARADPLMAVVARSAGEGLPVQALQRKILEGRAKRVPEPRIQMVVQQMVGHMREARGWLKKPGVKVKVPPAVLESVALARLAGVPAAELRTLVSVRGLGQASRRVDSLVDMRTRGFRGKETLRLVQRVHVRDLAVLGKTADAVRRRTRRPHTQVARSLLGALGPGPGGLQRAVQGLSTLPLPGAGPYGPGPGAGGGAGGGAGQGPQGPGPHGQKTRSPRGR